ncbi:MAG: peptidylprolyl isomerase [Prevotellaceae bacterium]|jgi:peptidyl-prolyl cis-trans isomerase SurA|nr:peptidylprolyl isomerase [Prevotellaceae bacterium]
MKNKKWYRMAGVMLACMLGSAGVGQQNVLDKVLAVVGNEALLESDLDVELMQLRAQGQLVDDETTCRIFEQLLTQKLLLAQARLDSLKENDMWIEQRLEQQMRSSVLQLGSTQAVESFYGKSVAQIKHEWTLRLREMSLTQQMHENIVSKVQLTPHDVQRYYLEQSPDSFPMLPEQYVIQQIARYPPSGNEVRFAVREKLLELRERVMNGDKFQTLAVMYSEDPGSARRGGELGFNSREGFVKPFSDAAFALKPGQVSQIVETEYGFHIIQMIERKDDMANLRHILIRPKFSGETQQQASRLLDSVATLIRADSITFERAVMRYSEDKNTRLNNGYAVNPQTLSTRFDKDQLATDYYVLRDMKVGQISAPFESKDNSGNDIYKTIKLTELIPAHRATYEQDYMVVLEIAKAKQQQKAFEEWIGKRIKTSYIVIDADMRSCQFSHNGWIK